MNNPFNLESSNSFIGHYQYHYLVISVPTHRLYIYNLPSIGMGTETRYLIGLGAKL